MASDFERVFEALAGSGVRYLAVGGVAVVVHGFPRFTADLDIWVDLGEDNVRLLAEALAPLEFRPRPPVPLSALGDPDIRAAWARDKGMVALSLWSPRFPLTELDVFITQPFDFEAAWRRAVRVKLGATQVTVVCREDLVRLKLMSARPKDLEDVRHLRLLSQRGRPEPGGDA